jgi:transcription antitermination factor NusG
MPILKRGTEVFPSDLLDRPPAQLPWMVANVRSRQEKALARYLEPCGVPFYLPLHENAIRRAGRRFISFLPLFAGYVFLRGSHAERHAALRSNLIARILEPPDQEELSRELRELRRLQESGASLTPCANFEPGQRVRVLDGPFAGYTGVVVRGTDRPRLVVSISMLQRAVAVEFDREVLIPARAFSARLATV